LSHQVVLVVAKLVGAERKSPAFGGGIAPNTKSSKLDHYRNRSLPLNPKSRSVVHLAH
jgi:hypothetical protein